MNLKEKYKTLIENESHADYKRKEKYDDAHDRKQGFIKGAEFAIETIEKYYNLTDKDTINVPLYLYFIEFHGSYPAYSVARNLDEAIQKVRNYRGKVSSFSAEVKNIEVIGATLTSTSYKTLVI